VAFSPDGALALTGSEDQTARLWEASSGRPFGAPFRAGDRVRTVAFRRDGREVVLGGWNGTARLWDLPSRNALAAPFGGTDVVLATAWIEGGASIRLAAEDARVYRWTAPAPVAGSGERAVLWTQVITGMELEPGGATRVLDAPVWRERWEQLQKVGGSIVE
jgi:hypothetical protein